MARFTFIFTDAVAMTFSTAQTRLSPPSMTGGLCSRMTNRRGCPPVDRPPVIDRGLRPSCVKRHDERPRPRRQAPLDVVSLDILDSAA